MAMESVRRLGGSLNEKREEKKWRVQKMSFQRGLRELANSVNWAIYT